MSSASIPSKSQKTRATRLIDADTEDNPDSLKRHKNLHWLHLEMEKYSQDVIDREICKRLRQFSGQLDFDLPKEVIMQIKGRSQVDTSLIPEGLLPFYRHYKFMYQRAQKSKS